MHANLTPDGTLIPPRTLAEGESRRAQLEAAIVKIDFQTAGRTHSDWRQRAGRARKYLVDEHKLLCAWLGERRATCEALLRDATSVLRALDLDGALEANEVEIARKIVNYLGGTL